MSFFLKNSKLIFLLSFVVMFSFSESYAQNRNAALSMQEQAKKYYLQDDYRRAIIFAVKSISKDSTFAEPLILLANIYQDKNDQAAAILSYRKGLKLDSINYSNAFLTLAEMELNAEYFKLAIKHANKFLTYKTTTKSAKHKGEYIIASAEFRQEAFMHPINIKKHKLKYSSDNTDEYINGISLNGEKLLFTKKTNIGIDIDGRNYFAEQIFEADLFEDSLLNPSLYEFPPEMQDRVGAASLSVDGRYLFFTVCNYFQAGNNCDIYCMSLVSEDSKVFNLGKNINTQKWESQPCFSSDGKTMYFASKREGGYGGSDIWISSLKEDGSFSRPKNAGDNINTSEDEMAPFIHADTRSLYFSSKGHPGMGGFDLFVSQKDISGQWTKAENLGYPLNTNEDEINMIIAPDGIKAFLSVKGKSFDLYHFDMENNKPNPVSYITGLVTDVTNSEPLFVRIELIDLMDAKTFAFAQSYAQNGLFMIPLPLNKSYIFNIKKEGYLFYSESFEVNDFADKLDTLHISLQPIQLDATVSLNNILFDIDKFDLLPESETELKILISFLENNANISIEIGGHTDNVGRTEYNQILSENRAKAVYDYLLKNGITPERLSFKGYGESVAISTNNEEEGRALNRRTEIKITEIR